jgi:hypothetical protein
MIIVLFAASGCGGDGGGNTNSVPSISSIDDQRTLMARKWGGVP